MMKALRVMFALVVLVGSLAFAAGRLTSGDKKTSSAPKPTHDLTRPEYDPPDCPAWAKQKLPAWVQPYVGKNGLPAKWRDKPGPLATGVKGLDRYQANNFICHRPETAEYIYKQYTPLKVTYKRGTLLTYEKVVAKYTAGLKTDTAKAVALMKNLAEYFPHPVVPPCGPPTRADRNLDDEALLKSGCGWCNEQSRVFIRLCQVSGIPARMIHLFGQHHTMSEFYADGKWRLADTSWLFVAPGKDGKLLSVADCHDGGEGQRYYAIAKRKRMLELSKMSDKELNMRSHEKAEEFRKTAASEIDVDKFTARRDIVFGVMNYPLPK